MDPSDVGGLAEDWRGRTRLGKRKVARMDPSDARVLAEDCPGRRVEKTWFYGSWREQRVESTDQIVESRV